MPLHARIAEAEAVVIAVVRRATAFGSDAIYHQLTHEQGRYKGSRCTILIAAKNRRHYNWAKNKQHKIILAEQQAMWKGSACHGSLQNCWQQSWSPKQWDFPLESNSCLDGTKVSWSPQPLKNTRRAPRDRTSQIVCCSIMANHSKAILQTATARGKLAATEPLRLPLPCSPPPPTPILNVASDQQHHGTTNGNCESTWSRLRNISTCT